MDIQTKLKELPTQPGVYFHKDTAGDIIYVGKAANLRNRVRQYFQKSRLRDPKTDALISEIVDLDWMVVESELEALFLEAEMVRRYMPRYNILLRDDKSMVYIRIDYDSDYPTVTTTRRPLDDKARYFGPYLSVGSVRQALKLLRRIFPFATKHTPNQKRATLHYHLGLDPGLEEGKTTLEEYRANLRKLMAVIEGRRKSIERELEKEMKSHAKKAEFEAAAKARNQLYALRRLNQQIVFSDKEFLDISKDQALSELAELLDMEKIPRRIEGYDISHMSGTDVVASMVVFTNGVSNKGEYRKFKTAKNQNNDFDNMRETIRRRFALNKGFTSQKGKILSNSKNAWKLQMPDMVLIDGGKGQVAAALQAMVERDIAVPVVGLAKRLETIIVPRGDKEFEEINLPHSSHLVKLLQRIRDESHRFAVSYHSILKAKRQTVSALDDIPGIGPATRKKLLKTFGSLRAITQASPQDLEKAIGPKKATSLIQHLSPKLSP